MVASFEAIRDTRNCLKELASLLHGSEKILNSEKLLIQKFDVVEFERFIELKDESREKIFIQVDQLNQSLSRICKESFPIDGRSISTPTIGGWISILEEIAASSEASTQPAEFREILNQLISEMNLTLVRFRRFKQAVEGNRILLERMVEFYQKSLQFWQSTLAEQGTGYDCKGKASSNQGSSIFEAIA
jgi:hypothetical protein